QIETALRNAQCAVVVWTEASVSPAGDFVRDEARLAESLGILVTVLLDKVNPPLGFGEVQTINLNGWRGSRRDPFFRDLCSTIQAKLEGRPIPPATGYAIKMRQRMLYSALSLALIALPIAFGLNFLGIQNGTCSISTSVSDLCGAMKLGESPTKTERLSWEAIAPGSCEDLRDHIATFPNGMHTEEASSLLAARTENQIESWVPFEQRLDLFIGQQAVALSSEEAAKQEALERGVVSAQRLCKNFSAAASFEVASSAPEAQSWDCSYSSGRVACSFEGEAVCQLQAKEIQMEESC
ncbi:MAG: hypothetical protein AAF564_14355, partial [Bacteroidota bacterium]